MNHTLGEAYLKRLRTFEQPNPAAHRFLTRLQQEGPEHGLWMSAGTGVHLYKGDGFLTHVQLSNAKSRPFWLLFTQHDQISPQASDASHLLLPHPLVRLVMKSGGFRSGWAAARGTGVEFTPNAPQQFYEALFQKLCALQMDEAPEAAAP